MTPSSTPVVGSEDAAGLLMPSIACEQSSRQLMIVLAQHRRVEAALASHTFTGGRLKVLPPGSTQAQHRRESVLVRCVTIAEAFVREQLVLRLTPQVPSPRAPLVEKLYAEFEDRGTSSWVAMGEYFEKYVSKQLRIRSGASPFAQVWAIIEVRNALVHGLGGFTARQKRNTKLPAIKKSLITLQFKFTHDEDGIIVTPICIGESVKALITYIEWVDRELQKNAPMEAPK